MLLVLESQKLELTGFSVRPRDDRCMDQRGGERETIEHEPHNRKYYEGKHM